MRTPALNTEYWVYNGCTWVYNEWPVVLIPRILIPKILLLSRDQHAVSSSFWTLASSLLSFSCSQLLHFCISFLIAYSYLPVLFYFIVPEHLETKRVFAILVSLILLLCGLLWFWPVCFFPPLYSHTSGGKKGLPREFLGELL